MNFPRNISGTELLKYKNSLKLSDEQKDILIGTLLGDATMGLRGGVPWHGIKFEQSEIHADYILHLFEKFKDFCGSEPQYRTKKTKNKAIWFRTYTHSSFKFYFDLFYDLKTNTDGKKVSLKKIPKNIKKFLNARALAYWFMDDGTFKNPKRGKRQYYFSTHGFNKDDCEKIRLAFKEVFYIETTLENDHHKFKLYIKQEFREVFLDLIFPHIYPCFYYKLCDSDLSFRIHSVKFTP